MTDYILYNPLSGNGLALENAKTLTVVSKKDTSLIDVTEIGDYKSFIDALSEDDRIILCGGDGTLNRFINDTEGIDITNEILYCGGGTGNDFLHDIGATELSSPIRINEYITNLPTVTVNGKTCRFLNNVGFGIDGYCCEVGDEQKKRSKKKVNYTSIAIKGLLFHFKPRGATVTVDGQEYRYENVWLAPTMKGRFYGGGMLPTPLQDRSSATHELSVMVMHGSGKLKTLLIFPSIFKGTHVKHQKHVAIHTGKEITVTFDTPCALQIDGETVLNVTSYTAKACLLNGISEKNAVGSI